MWRADVACARTQGRLTVLAYSLEQDGVDWEWVDAHCTPVDRRSWAALVDKPFRNYVPAQGDTVVYYPQGHAETVQGMARQIARPLPSSS